MSFLFGAFLLFIAVAGVASHVTAMVARGSLFETEKREALAAAQTAPGGEQAATAAATEPPKRNLVRLCITCIPANGSGPSAL